MELQLHVFNSFKIYQPKYGYHFSMEPFILTKDIGRYNNLKNIVDFGSGSGIISILLSKFLDKKTKIYAIESNKNMAEIIEKNIELNSLHNIEVLQNITEIDKNSVDLIISNPPYFNSNYRPSKKFYSEKFEKEGFEHCLSSFKGIIKNKGILKISYHPTRMFEVMQKINNNGFGIKNICPVYGNRKNSASFVIIESKFGAKNYIECRKAIYLDNDLTTFIR